MHSGQNGTSGTLLHPVAEDSHVEVGAAWSERLDGALE